MGKMKAWRKAAKGLNALARQYDQPGPQGRKHRNMFMETQKTTSPFVMDLLGRNPVIHSLRQVREAAQKAVAEAAATEPQTTTDTN